MTENKPDFDGDEMLGGNVDAVVVELIDNSIYIRIECKNKVNYSKLEKIANVVNESIMNRMKKS